MDMLQERRVSFSAPGRPHKMSEGDSVTVDADMLRPATVHNHMLSALLRTSAEAKHDQLLSG
eukprot:2800318-Karenia_brevis.AAC.1